MARTRWLALIAIGVLAVTSIAQAPPAKAAVVNGRIAFMRFDVAAQDQFVWTVNPDGTHEEQVVPYAAERPHWSPDGRELMVLCCDAAARIITMATGAERTLPWPTGLFLGCQAWSADGRRVLCEGFGDSPDGNDMPELNGIYSIRASDGGDVQRVTDAAGGDDIPQDLSPDGSQLVYISDRDLGSLFFVGVEGGPVRSIGTGGLVDISSASWSPDGQWILFPARKAFGVRRSLFEIHPDGSGLQEITIDPACGGSQSSRDSRGCLDPVWAPDGSKILFDIFQGYNFQKQIQTIDPDGSHRHDVTHHGFVLGDDEGEQGPDWGTSPLH